MTHDLSEDEIRERVRNALRRVVENDYHAESVPDRLLLAVLPPEGYPTPIRRELSERERQVILAASCGLTNEEIGVALGISINTILTHLKRINEKLAAKNRTHAVAIALREKIIY
jgi:Response regulator containing a CheY-like receiver domain and an HTH DNA-binding domain